MKIIFTRALALCGLAALLSLSAFAQQTTTTPNSGAGQANIPGGGAGRQGRLGRRLGRGGQRGDASGGARMERRALRRLNLSEAQRGQLRDIEARYAQGFKTQREELRQLLELRRAGTTLTPEQQERARQLGAELRANGKNMHAEILALLTPEQREQLRQMRAEGRARREDRRAAPGVADDQPDDNQ